MTYRLHIQDFRGRPPGSLTSLPKKQHLDFDTEAEANTKRAELQRQHGDGYLMCVKELLPPVARGAKKSRQGALS